MLAALALLVLAAAPALGGEGAARGALSEASVELASGCSGAVAESPHLIVTAHHCVDQAAQAVRVRLSTGESRQAWIAAVDEEADQAVLFLEEPAPVEPLVLVRRPQMPGTVLYFEGHPGRPRFQSARLERIGRCSSLPALPDALFTTIRGSPGDSGAPLVDVLGRVVGLVHGGANCHIATPAGTLARLIDDLLGRETVQLTRAPRSTPSYVPVAIPSRRIFA